MWEPCLIYPNVLDETLRSMCGCGYDDTGSKFPILINIRINKTANRFALNIRITRYVYCIYVIWMRYTVHTDMILSVPRIG